MGWLLVGNKKLTRGWRRVTQIARLQSPGLTGVGDIDWQAQLRTRVVIFDIKFQALTAGASLAQRLDGQKRYFYITQET